MKWNSIETAPKDGSFILVWYDHEANPIVEDIQSGRLTAYGAWAESGDFLDGTGYAIAFWQDSQWESVDEYGTGYWLPATWFAWFNDDAQFVVNPLYWSELHPPRN